MSPNYCIGPCLACQSICACMQQWGRGQQLCAVTSMLEVIGIVLLHNLPSMVREYPGNCMCLSHPSKHRYKDASNLAESCIRSNKQLLKEKSSKTPHGTNLHESCGRNRPKLHLQHTAGLDLHFYLQELTYHSRCLPLFTIFCKALSTFTTKTVVRLALS